jgi:hypothetical protein
MEDWITKKDQIVERLMYFSARMAEEARVGRLPEFEKFVDERAKLFEELTECDRQIAGLPTPKDSIWTNELEQLKKVDDQIANLLREHRSHVEREMNFLGRSKAQLLQSESIDPKGNSLATHG